jgi:hypothetical protein
MRRLALLIVVVAACRTQPLPDPTLSASPTSSDGGDGGSSARLDGGQCVAHSLSTVRLDALQLVDPAEALHRQQAVRVRADIPFQPGCDIPADVAVDVAAGNETDFVTITARVWRSDERAGCGAPAIDSRVLPIASANFRVHVSDGAPGATRTLDIVLGSPVGAGCGAIAVGGACQRDCECQASDPAASCVPVSPTMALCALSCTVDADCATAARPRCHQGATPPDTCDAVGDGCCARGCPFGEACDSCVCRPSPRAAGASCRCDGDCDALALCAGGRCVAPCARSSECSAPETCAGECR